MSDTVDEIDVAASAVSTTLNSIKSFASGGFGGVCAVLVGQPFDLTKVRMQTATPGQYKSTLDCVKQTIARDGVRGLYRGMGPPLIGVTPMFAVSFWGYSVGKDIVKAVSPNPKGAPLTYTELAAAGFISAVPTTFVAAPVERVKVMLQVEGQGASPRFHGPGDVIKHLYKEGGLKSIFRGTGATLARDGPGSSVYFVVYEAVKKALTPEGSDLSLGAVLFAGGSAGIGMWSFAIPPDVIKSRIQSSPEGTYKGFLDAAVKTVKADGVGSLFKGIGPAMLRAFPANAATFLGVEVAQKALDKLF